MSDKNQVHPFKSDFQKFTLRIYQDICKYAYLVIINIVWVQVDFLSHIIKAIITML